ncbi:hypothetical protein SAY86_024906 [Trapa natans]|uniref:Uncharacterized protein n=1 Tax=Trapa natans TaxID=22666 RepID=A0AAN7M6Q8_TRANT|nr:hypothetical protein SAY86_024906 [Trapa natans]
MVSRELFAELSCRDNHIKELTASTSSSLEYEKIKSSLREHQLENKVEMQTVLILDGTEKEEEAIRQLFLSLEHYKTGYHELGEAFVRHNKRRAVHVRDHCTEVSLTMLRDLQKIKTEGCR